MDAPTINETFNPNHTTQAKCLHVTTHQKKRKKNAYKSNARHRHQAGTESPYPCSTFYVPTEFVRTRSLKGCDGDDIIAVICRLLFSVRDGGRHRELQKQVIAQAFVAVVFNELRKGTKRQLGRMSRQRAQRV